MQANRKIVVIYPGRFQPMLPHHVEVLRQLGATYGDDVYVGTTGKVDPEKGNYFSFEEKVEIANTMYGINPDHILEVKSSPYLDREYRPHFNDSDVLIFAVGEKDAAERFPFGNMNSDGVNLKKDGSPSYMQPLQGNEDRLESMSKHAYVAIAPNVEVDGEVASASAFRKAFAGAEDDQHAKEVFEKFFGSYNESVFQLVNQKLRGPKSMNESIDQLRKLAGILNESAPVDFEGDDSEGPVDPADEFAAQHGLDRSDDALLTPEKKRELAGLIVKFKTKPATEKQIASLSSLEGAYDLDNMSLAADQMVEDQDTTAIRLMLSIASATGEDSEVANYAGRIGDKLEDKDFAELEKDHKMFTHQILKRIDLGRGSSEEVDENDEIERVSLSEEDSGWYKVTTDSSWDFALVLKDCESEDHALELAAERFPDTNWTNAEAIPNPWASSARTEVPEGVETPKYLQLYETLGDMIGRAIEGSAVTDQLAEYLEQQGLDSENPEYERLQKNNPGFALFLDTLIETADIRVYNDRIRSEIDGDDYVGEGKDEKPDFLDLDDDGDTDEPMKDAAKDKEELDEYDDFDGVDEEAPQPGDVVDHEQKGRLLVLDVVHDDIYGQPAVYLVRNQAGNEFQMSYDFLVGAVDQEIEGALDDEESQPTNESEDRPYVCVHAKKGKCDVTASSSYGAAKKAAEKWGLKSTAGIDAYPADKPVEPAQLGEAETEADMLRRLAGL
jgi:hypothetical protein